jgi:hypothetical protein
MERDKWLNSLTIGSEVCIPHRYGDNYDIATVVRLTKTLIIVRYNGKGYEEKYRKDDGCQPGSGYHRSSSHPLTEERRESADVYQLRIKAKHLMEKLTVPFDRQGVDALIAALTPFVEKPKSSCTPTCHSEKTDPSTT